jgi:hypothetical protein
MPSLWSRIVIPHGRIGEASPAEVLIAITEQPNHAFEYRPGKLLKAGES